MQTAQWELASLVGRDVIEAPYRFEATQLIVVLLQALRRQGIGREPAFGRVIRFASSTSLAFPPSEVSDVSCDADQVRVTAACIGLFGANGALPWHDTERAEEWHGFADAFANRVIAMYFQAWGKHRAEYGVAACGQDLLRPLLAALAGLPTGAKTVHYAGLLRSRPTSAQSLEQMLEDFLGVPVRVGQFVGHWVAIPLALRTVSGVSQRLLGVGTVLGPRMWRADCRVLVEIGPLDEEQLENFLPGGSARSALCGLLTRCVPRAIDVEIKLLLGPSCIRPLTLGRQAGWRPRLGWNTFLTRNPGVAANPFIRFIFQPGASEHEC